jgi:DNA primase
MTNKSDERYKACPASKEVINIKDILYNRENAGSVGIVVEGIFDALSLNACALTHNTINPEQVELLAQLNRRIIFVPDRDKTGLETCDRALELGYSVSIPNWSAEVKDVNDAVCRYGRLPTLLSILQTATTSRIKVELRKKHVVRLLTR